MATGFFGKLFGKKDTKKQDAKTPAAPTNVGKGRQLPNGAENDPEEYARTAENWANEQLREIQSGNFGAGEGLGNTISAEDSQPVDSSVVVGKVTFKTHKENTIITASEGSLSVLGAETAWQAVEPIPITDHGNGDIMGAGAITLNHETVKFGESVFISANGKESAVTVGSTCGIVYAENGIELCTGIIFSHDLSEIEPQNLSVQNPVIGGIEDSPFSGDLKITSGGVQGSAEKSALGLLAVPNFIKSWQKKLTLQNDGGLKYKVEMPDAVTGFELGNVLKLAQTAPISGEIAQDGAVNYHIDGKGFVLSVFGKELTSLDIPGNIDVSCTDSGTDLAKLDIRAGDQTLGKLSAKNLVIGADFQNSEFTLSVDSIAIDGFPIELESTAVKATPDGFSVEKADIKVHMGDDDVEGSITNLMLDGNQGLTVESIKVKFPDKQLFEGFSLKGAELLGSIKNDSFSIEGSTEAEVDVKSTFFKLSSESLKVNLSYKSSGGEEPPAENAEAKEGGLADEKLGGFSAGFEGSLKAAILAGGNELASAQAEKFAYSQGKFTLGSLSMAADFSNAFKSFSGNGEFAAEGLSYSSADGLDFEKLTASISEPQFNGKALPANVTIEIQKGAENSENTAETGSDSAISLDDDTEGKLTNVKVSLTLDEQNPEIGIEADKIDIDLKLFGLSSKDFALKLTNTSAEGSFGEVEASSEILNEKLKNFCGIENLALKASDLSYADGKFSVGAVSAAAEGEIKLIGGLSVINPEFTYDIKEKSADLGFGLKYEGDFVKSVSGETSLDISLEGISFKEFKNFVIDLGVWGKGGIKSIEKTEGGLNIHEIKLEREKTDDASEDTLFEGMNPILAKILKFMPTIGVRLENLAITENGITKPDPKEFTITEFESPDINLSDGIKGKFGYKGGTLSAGLTADSFYPKEREEKEDATRELCSPSFSYQIIPPILSAEIGLHAGAGFSVKADAQISTAKDESNVRSFSGAINASAKGNIYVGAFAGLKLSVGVAEASAKLSGDVKGTGDAGINGKSGFKYDPAKPFLQSFSLDRENTAASFEIGAKLSLELNFTAGGEAGLPAVVAGDKKLKLYHSWNLLSCDLGDAKISGSVKYKDGVWVKDGEAAFNYANKFDMKKVEEEVAMLGETYDKLKADMDAVNAICEKVSEGNGEILGLGQIMQDKTVKGLGNLYQKLDEIRKEALNSSSDTYSLLVIVRHKLEKTAEKEEKNLKEVEALEAIEKQTVEANNILGLKNTGENENSLDDNPYPNGVTKEQYEEFVKNLRDVQNNDEKLSALANLDPVAVMNMFKIYKLRTDKSWESIRPPENITSVRHDLEKNENAVAAPDGKIFDSKIFTTALKSLDELQEKAYSEIAKKQEEIDRLSQELADGTFNRKSKEENLNKAKMELEALLEKSNKSAALSSSIKGFGQYLESENTYVKNITDAAGGKFKDSAILSAAAPSQDIIILRKAWLREVISHISAAYYDLSKFKANIAFNNKSQRQFTERKQDLENEQAFEAGISDTYGLGYFNTFEKKKTRAEAYKKLKATYFDINSSLRNYFSLIENTMTSTERLQKISYNSMKSASEIKANSAAIADVVKNTEEAQKTIPKNDSAVIKDLIKKTA